MAEETKTTPKVDDWTASGPVVDPKYDPREDPGPERLEDDPKFVEQYVLHGRKLAKSDSKEVPLEDSRRDETTVLASDAVPQAEAPSEG